MALATAQGSLLKSTREARGISLQAVHEATKIPMDILRAIEEGYSVRTLTPFYLKGFIKMYAEYLKINVQDIHVEERKPERPTAAPVLKPRVVPPSSPLPVETLDLEQWFAGVFTHRRKQQIAILAVALFGFFLLFKAITFFTHRRPPTAAKAETKKEKSVAKKSSASSASQAAVLPKKPVTTVASIDKTSESSTATAVKTSLPKTATTAPAAVPTQTAAPSAQLDRDIMLTVRAKKDSWLRVEADGVTVFQAALNRGKAETWLAQDKIEISGKNLPQLEFELNGKLIGTLGRRDYRAKRIVISREGLSVVP